MNGMLLLRVHSQRQRDDPSRRVRVCCTYVARMYVAFIYVQFDCALFANLQTIEDGEPTVCVWARPRWLLIIIKYIFVQGRNVIVCSMYVRMCVPGICESRIVIRLSLKLAFAIRESVDPPSHTYEDTDRTVIKHGVIPLWATHSLIQCVQHDHK